MRPWPISYLHVRAAGAWYNFHVKRTPLFILVLLVAVPLVLLTWIGVKLARHERAVVRQQIRDALSDRLQYIDGVVTTHFEGLGRDMHEFTAVDAYDADALRERIRNEARVYQLFVIEPNGRLLYPDPDPFGQRNRNEEEFLSRASQIITDRELQRAAAAQSDNAPAAGPQTSASTGKNTAPAPLATGPSSGWFVWYWGRGLNLIYWQRRESGHLVGAALNRSRWIADLIAALPDTPQQSTAEQLDRSAYRIRLIDSTSRPVYQWGHFEPPESAVPLGEIPLSVPMSAWRLQHFIPAERFAAGSPSSVYFNLGAGLGVAALGLVALAIFFYREYARDIREAARRVSFVNQVSHELRTPLTNIRMYADLLESDLETLPEESARSPRGRLSVIQLESQRLSRLIGNVLAFARQQRRTLRIGRQPCCVDAVVAGVLERFRPSLEQLGIRIELQLAAERPVMADADAVEQILGNLISNVEKYAAGGRWLGVTTRQHHERTLITVADRGPGIEPAAAEAIFQPFWRGSSGLGGAAGTGIGLSIARELARLHGGDVTLVPSREGAVFEITLLAPIAGEETR